MVKFDAEPLAGLILPPACGAATQMQRIDGNYLYSLGWKLHPLSTIFGENEQGAMTYGMAFAIAYFAEIALDELLNQSIFKLRFSYQSGQALLKSVKQITEVAFGGQRIGDNVDHMHAYSVRADLTIFETNLASEFALMDTYIVAKKGALDTTDLIWNGAAFMPADLSAKVPAAIGDVEQATKCLAFELLTAVGFHIHRANECVLHRYYDVVTGGKPHPKTRNIGDYLRKLDEFGVGDQRVRTALRDLKDLHRNPLIHPEHSLETVDEAIDLLSAVRALVGQMLKEIPPVNVPEAP
ncbi:MAG TPA: hypothetical protein VGL58_20730 [Caulobacteraceae bacterium]|jgi:hypothetical protein